MGGKKNSKHRGSPDKQKIMMNDGIMPRSRGPSKHLLLDTIDASHNQPDYNADDNTVQITRARYWVLFIFCFIAICQSCTWNIFAPIYPVAFQAYPTWDSTYLYWLINTANFSFALSLYPVSLAIKKFGSRKVTIISAFFVLLGASLRCLPIGTSTPNTYKIIQLAAMLCNGLGGAYANFGGPLVSELWFPSEERTTATAVASVATYTGAALGFLVGPIMVGKPAAMSEAITAMKRLYYLEAFVCLLCFLLVLAYFPNQPKHPPSEAALVKREEAAVVAAAQERSNSSSSMRDDRLQDPLQDDTYSEYTEEGFSSSSHTLSSSNGSSGGSGSSLSVYFRCDMKSKKYWIVCLSMALPLGIFQGWSSAMFACLKPLDFTQEQASWLGFFTTVVGCVGSVVVGASLDRFQGRLKMVIEVCMLLASGSFVSSCIYYYYLFLILYSLHLVSFGLVTQCTQAIISCCSDLHLLLLLLNFSSFFSSFSLIHSSFFFTQIVFGINSAGYLNVDHHTGIIVAYVTAIVGGAMLNISVPLFFVRNSSPPSFSIFFLSFSQINLYNTFCFQYRLLFR